MTLQDIEASVVSCILASPPKGLRQVFLFGSRAAQSNKNPRADMISVSLQTPPWPLIKWPGYGTRLKKSQHSSRLTL